MARFLPTLVFIVLSLTPERVFAVSETVSTMWQSAHSAVKSLGDDAHSYLVSLLGKQAVETLLQNMGDAIKVISQAIAHALNAVTAYIADFLGAAGFNAKLPIKHFTPEGVIFVAKWALLAVIGYWLLSVAVYLLAGVVRRSFFLLKITFAIVIFGLILSDGGASAEITAMRLAGLMLACVMLGIGPSLFRGDSNAHLEQKVKGLERRLREVERKNKEE